MISICIPTYEQKGHGAKMLSILLHSIEKQTISYPYEIIISDNATDGSIKDVANKFQHLPLVFVHNPTRGASENINNAISHAKYDLIKLMMMDDVFTTDNAINLFVEALQTHSWVIANSIRLDENGKHGGNKETSYEHGQFEKNTTGMPSVIGFRKCDLRFDVRLKTFCDMYFYYQLFELYGQPGVIKEHCIGQRYWKHSLSHNQPPSHTTDRNFLIRHGMIGQKIKIVVAVVVYDRIENIELWRNAWDQSDTASAELIIINNGPHDIPGSIRRDNIGFDIGAFQDVCKQRLEGFPNDWDYLLWCTDDTIPMSKDFIAPFINGFGKQTGITCMQMSDEYTRHVRTTGFCIKKDLSLKLRFPADQITTVQECWHFEHRGGKETLFRQIINMRLNVIQVAKLQDSPLYDMGFWYRNEKAKLQAAKENRMKEHYKIFQCTTITPTAEFADQPV